MKIDRSIITIAILTVIDCIIGTIVISKCMFQEQIDNPIKYEAKMEIVEEIKDLAPVVVADEPIIVYDGMTLEQLAEKLELILNATLEGTGMIYATKSIEYGVDPYLAVAISLHETGCKWGCSKLVKNCNNVGGMIGKPSCNGGSYIAFSNLEEGIDRFISNLARNYYAYGLTTPEEMNPKYAADPAWSEKVNKYINEIKAL